MQFVIDPRSGPEPTHFDLYMNHPVTRHFVFRKACAGGLPPT